MDARQKQQVPTTGQYCYPCFLDEDTEILHLRKLPKIYKLQEGTDSNPGVSDSRTHSVSI